MELGNKTYTFYHLYTFKFKKLKHFLNMTDYKIFLIKSFLITYLSRSLVVCKYRDSNMFGNPPPLREVVNKKLDFLGDMCTSK